MRGIRVAVAVVLSCLFVWLPRIAESDDAGESAKVAFVGVISSDMPTAETDEISGALDSSIFRVAGQALSREATQEALRSNPVIADACVNALAAKKAGAKALEALNLDEASAQLSRAGGYYRRCHGFVLSPAEVADLYTLRARVEFGKRNERNTYLALKRALPTHPTKQLDEAVYPPEVVALFKKAIRDSQATSPVPPSADALVDIAKRTGVQWVVHAETQRGPQSIHLLVTVVEQTGDLHSKRIKLPVLGDRTEALDEGIRELFRESGILQETVAAVQPVPDQALPNNTRPTHGSSASGRPVYKRWYLWAAAAAVVAGGVTAASLSNTGTNPGPGPSPTPPPAGITIVVEGP